MIWQMDVFGETALAGSIMDFAEPPAGTLSILLCTWVFVSPVPILHPKRCVIERAWLREAMVASGHRLATLAPDPTWVRGAG